jgi:uncharacterized protein with NRDE domain
MCLLLIAIDQHPDYPWIIAANRDEFRDRPTAPMAWWADRPDLLAGRDLRAGGTWMGVTRHGRFAALTNYREPRCVFPRGPSRGFLVTEFLMGTAPPQAHLAAISERGRRYDGFNLVAGDIHSGLFYYGNRGLEGAPDGTAGSPPKPLAPGIYGLSNHRLDTPWPKVLRGKSMFTGCLAAAGAALDTCLLKALADTTQPADPRLPDTGFDLAWERILAPLFINSPHYGTRSCSVVRLDRQGHFDIMERTLPQPGESGKTPVDRHFRFKVAPGQAQGA